jgi:hypothetical protein
MSPDGHLRIYTIGDPKLRRRVEALRFVTGDSPDNQQNSPDRMADGVGATDQTMVVMVD